MENRIATKGDLKNLATKKEVKEIRTGLSNLEDKVDGITERIDKIPTREELPILIARAIDSSSLKETQDRIIKALREKLHVEI